MESTARKSVWIATACLWGGLTANALAAEDFVGQVVSVSGKVLVRSEAAKTQQMNFLKAGDKLAKGAILNTGSTGTAKLLMVDKTIIDLGPSSLFKVNEFQLNGTSDRKVDLSVDYGQVRASVNQKVNPDKGKFTIRTKAATMGVRGTEFVVNAGPAQGTAPQTSVTVIKGQVEVADSLRGGAPIKIDPGMQFVKPGEGAAQVVKLSGIQVAQVRAEAFQPDRTFLQSVVIEPTQEAAPPASAPTQTASKAPESETAAAGPETKTAEAVAAPAVEGVGNQTLKAVAENVTVTAANIMPVNVTDLRLPGVAPPPMIPPQSVQIIQGLPRNIQVIFNPN